MHPLGFVFAAIQEILVKFCNTLRRLSRKMGPTVHLASPAARAERCYLRIRLRPAQRETGRVSLRSHGDRSIRALNQSGSTPSPSDSGSRWLEMGGAAPHNVGNDGVISFRNLQDLNKPARGQNRSVRHAPRAEREDPRNNCKVLSIHHGQPGPGRGMTVVGQSLVIRRGGI
jgi:hypothetical protein